MSTLQFRLGVIAAECLGLLQLDLETTFLHGDLDKEIYMEELQGIASPCQEHLVCQLQKSLTLLNKLHDSGTKNSTTWCSR